MSPAAASAEALLLDASHRARDGEAKAEVRPDASIDPACAGVEVSFATALADARCAIGSSRAKQLRAALEREGDAALPLRQEASVSSDGSIALRLVNTGGASLTLPLSFAAKLPAFTVLAEDDQHTIYELEAPRFEVGSAGGAERPRFAHVALPAGGAAVATIGIQTGVTRVLARGSTAPKCDGGACTPARLVKGHYVLYVGELLTDVEAGAPARVPFEVP